MPSKINSAVAPTFLFACLVLGGSTQDNLQNLALQLAGLAIIGWSAILPSPEPISRPARLLLLFSIGAAALVAIQAIPWPGHFWANGVRGRITNDYRLLGQVPSVTVSLAPYASLATLLGLIPPLAIFCAMVRSSTYQPGWLAASLLAGTIAGVGFYIAQVAGGPGARTHLDASVGAAGFFQRADHMASLLLISLLFTAAIARAAGSRPIEHKRLLLLLLLLLALVLLAALTLTKSAAGHALAAPDLLASALLLMPRRSRWRRYAISLGLVSLGLSVATLTFASIDRAPEGEFAQSRRQILSTTGRAIVDFMPLGSGLGTFARVYPLYERPASVTAERVTHVHNDYAELVLELGLGGILLILLFLAWLGIAVRASWREGRSDPYLRAAAIASTGVLIQSLVDFPLRTAAVSACFAMCLALLADRRVPGRRALEELRPVRHIAIG